MIMHRVTFVKHRLPGQQYIRNKQAHDCYI